MIYLVVLLGLGLRLISLNQSFWLDEATSAAAAGMGVKQILSAFSLGDFHPPLYYLIIHFWGYLFGFSEVAIRMLSVLAGAGTLYVLYLIGKEVRDKKLGTIAALLLGTSGLHIYYSQEARMYSLAALFVSLTFLFFVKTLKRGRVGEWLMFSFFLALSAFTDYLPILVIPGLWLFALSQKLNASWWKKFFTSHIILVGAGLLWLPYFLKQLSAGLNVESHSPSWWQILGQTNFKQLILIPTKFIFGKINMELNLAQIMIVGVAFLVFGLLLFNSLKNRKVKPVWFWLIVPPVLASIISLRIPTLSYFRFLFILPAFYLLVGTGLLSLPKARGKALMIAMVAFNLVTSSYYLFNYKNQREDWRALTGLIKNESLGKSSVVIFVADSQQEAYRYYDKDAKIATHREIKGSEEILWLMRYVQEIFDPEDRARLKVEELGYKKAQEYNFNGVVVWKYENENRN